MDAVRKRIGSNQKGNSSPRLPDSGDSNMDGGRTLISNRPSSGAFDNIDLEGLSPELVPIVTLLSSQSNRRYNEGIFMLYYDLNGDGKPADREWREVYGILTGNQLAYWDAAILAQFKNNADALLEASAKPSYINFTDAVYSAMKSLPAAKQNLDNVVVVSTTLKNRYILQFKTAKDLETWYCALRLSSYEYKSLQEAYTGALLSARGSRLSDIRTILAEKRFDHEDWISIRYGSGMAWKRCYAVVEPSSLKRKTFVAGRILLFENEQKKKKQLMAIITDASAVTAIYPQSHLLIDHSTMIKMEGFINFSSPSLSTKVSKKNLDDFKQTSIFLMPEQHSAVPGFDTLIRFLVPLFDAFGLYGRPKRLKANRNDIDSLLFGLPTLPRVHYLELSDIQQLVARGNYISWDLRTWNLEIQNLLKSKIERGYDGCGSQRGYAGAVNSLNSPALSSSPRLPSSGSASTIRRKEPSGLSHHSTSHSGNSVQPSPSPVPPPPPPHSNITPAGKRLDKNIKNLEVEVPAVPQNVKNFDDQALNTRVNGQLAPGGVVDPHDSVQLAEIYQKYSDLKTPSDNYIDRREVLNGSQERLIEDDLPLGIRQMTLGSNAYPKNDDGLFSDDNDDEEESVEEISSVKSPRLLGVHNSGQNPSDSSVSVGSLKVPKHEQNGSYSSVVSPMAQFNDLHDQYNKVGKSVPFYGLQPDSSLEDNSIDQNADTRQHFGANLDNFAMGHDTTHKQQPQQPQQPQQSQQPHQTASPYPIDAGAHGAGVPYPANRPRHIVSPNSSHNQLSRPSRAEVARESTSPTKKDLQYPVSPQRKAPPTEEPSSSEQLKSKTNIPKSNKQFFVPLGGQTGQNQAPSRVAYPHESAKPQSEFGPSNVGTKPPNHHAQQPLPQFQVSTPNQQVHVQQMGGHQTQPMGRPRPSMNPPTQYGVNQPRTATGYQGQPQQYNNNMPLQPGPQRSPNMGIAGHQQMGNRHPQQHHQTYQSSAYGQPNNFRSYDNQQYQYTPNVQSPGVHGNQSHNVNGPSPSKHPYAQYSRTYNFDRTT
ncbi:hypothetical protein CANMA_001184 [Candida margitis]|uniref:uncharacterized protein n=1 Tax=Candida margitis TaxID=1775924 RepID=UPI0022268263|nr:uncharacterized protein CANMA_001184 [Candida margitis]KAI5969722.1 hypothetical protein CANMA_001184 [Candida margitis]